MNESFPPLTSAEPPLPDHKDRSTGLMIFGVLTILLGCLSMLLVVFALLGQAVNTQRNGQAVQAPGILVTIAVYGGTGAALIWLGIGSIQARRWARALLVIFSWTWLLIGVVATAGSAILLPKVMANLPAGPQGPVNPPPGTIAVIMGVMLLFFGFFFILLPAAWTFFYSSRHVKATCEERDPIARWTDACPLPVLALSIWALISGPMMFLMPLGGHWVIPFFGMFLAGWPAGIYSAALGILWIWFAWITYRLQPIGWWLVFTASVLMVVSHTLTLMRHDLVEMYQLMGYPQVQIDQMQKMGVLLGHGMGWLAVILSIPFLGYLIFIKKYFRTTS